MWQLVFMINGYFIGILGFAMLIVAAFDMYLSAQNWSHFLTGSLISFFIGISLFLSNKTEIKGISIKQGYLITVFSWTTIALLSALPFILYGCTDYFHDAFFESMSGLTATGATIFNDVESLPAPILLWRSMLNAMGGVGIVIFAVALLPFLGIGGMQIFQRENSDIEKFMPKFHYIAKRIIAVYIFFNAACAFSLHFFGMNWFDAANHAMATIATAGFSTKNSSIAYFNSLEIELTISLFTIIASLPMTFYILLLQNKFRHSLKTTQIFSFFKILAMYVLFTSLWLVYNGYYSSFLTALRYASFNVISTVTTTGFASVNYMSWGIAGTVFLLFSLTGGCTGSTSGSIKIFRWQVVWAYLKQSISTAIEPSRIMPVKIKQYVVDSQIISSVLIFIAFFLVSVIVLTIVLALTGLNFDTSLSSVIACMTNTGIGSVNTIGPDGNYAFMPVAAKNTLTFAMLLGRLEILTVLVVFTRSFWRK